MTSIVCSKVPSEPISMDNAAFTSSCVQPLSSAFLSCCMSVALTLSCRL
eukprot:CAMPEP_0168436950 /NCGR_PEP_ID=MMETSP0228-20121227/41185_1 /TAXON_ID=133427 /ORGANISM="Protoceratium reticulatum, Strain CCCM 535 (=CCMP 1889)" /LENGTH=48 /DNA_ID= /DNA_START= /DNA_END= /DNA_ORIENTATION=